MEKIQILVVEDEVIVAEDIRRSLQKLGYSVPAIVSRGDDAIKKISEYKPDLVMMDIMLQGDMDGIETASEIHSRLNIPVIYLTAYSDRKTLERAKLTEPFGYLVKPFKESELSIAIEMALFKHGMEMKLKENEAWFTTLLKSISDAVIATDPKGCVKYMNNMAQSLTGWELENAAGMPLKDVFNIVCEKTGENINIKTIKSKAGVIKGDQVLLVARNKTKIPIGFSIDPIMDENGNSTGTVLVFSDITEQRKAEEIRLEKERLDYANRAKSEFLANMSHELRTPLNAVIGFSELLKQKACGEINEKQEHYIDHVIEGSKHLLNLINDILDLSKVEAGKMELTVEEISVPLVIDETIDLIKEKASKHNVSLEKEIDNQLELIEADKKRFKQVLFNLLSNAVKFSKNDGGTVTVKAKKEGYMAKISVSDKGIGIRKEDMGKLFKSFQQLDSGIARKYDGTGLGLVISKKLVELHGGKMMVESKYGEGSTFTFLIPIAGNAENEK